MEYLLSDEQIKKLTWHTTSYEPKDNQITYSLNEVREILHYQIEHLLAMGWLPPTECELCGSSGYLPNDDTGEPNPPVGGIRCPICKGGGYLDVVKAERERVIKWMDEPCPHTGGLEEQQAYKSGCPKCWQALEDCNSGTELKPYTFEEVCIELGKREAGK